MSQGTSRGGAPPRGRPAVSVIIPVWNARPYLDQCLGSVVGQTIGLERIEVIVVDDGSSDGSSDVLDRYAERYDRLTVIHEPCSGGPGRPRNVALDLASGEFVFFLDADDYLGPEALARMVAMAERYGSDVVLGRMVGLDGRSLPNVYGRTVGHARIEEVYRTVSVLKLFRRALIDRLDLRFEEGIPGHEDGPFTLQAYWEARGISIVADYPCYYARPSGGSRAKLPRVAWFERIERERIELLARHRRPGWGRDGLMVRHLVEVIRSFDRRWVETDLDERRREFDVASGILRRWHTDRTRRLLAQWDDIRAHCLRSSLRQELEDILVVSPTAAYGDPMVEGRRLYARLPHFRDEASIPDRCFDITRHVVVNQAVRAIDLADRTLTVRGQAYLSLVGGRTAVCLRRRPFGAPVCEAAEPVPTPDLRDRQRRYTEAGFVASIDLASAAQGRPLPDGTWELLLSVGTATVRRLVPVRVSGGAAGARPGTRQVAAVGRVVIVTTGLGLVRLWVGRRTVLHRSIDAALDLPIRTHRLVDRFLARSGPGRIVLQAMEHHRPSVLGERHGR